VDTSGYPSVFISHYNGHGIKLVIPLSTVDNTRDYGRVSHSRQWSNYNITCTGTDNSKHAGENTPKHKQTGPR